MRKFLSLGLILTLLPLGGCTSPAAETPLPAPTPTVEAAPSPQVTVTPEPTPTPQPEETPYTGPWQDSFALLSRLDLSSYEGELSDAEWEALKGFFPVLNNEVPMLAAHLSGADKGVTPTEEVYFWDIYETYSSESSLYPQRQIVMAFSLTPITGEEPDLVLSMDFPMGWYLLIHREGERFYAVYMPIRWFFLDAGGLYSGSGGAAVAYYYRLSFSDGTFTSELLANTDWGEWDEEGRYLGNYYAVGGVEVTLEEFEAWMDENLTGDAIWYPAREGE